MKRKKPARNTNEILIKEIDSWKLSYSIPDRCLCINTTDYHPFALKLSRSDLTGLLETVDKMIEGESSLQKKRELPLTNNNNKRSRFKILVVDAHAIPLQVITNILEQEGYDVVNANNGLEALEIFKEGKFDLVTTGIKMPKMDGVTLLGNLKRIAPQTPVIVLTAYSSIDAQREAIRIGAHALLYKPIDKEEFLTIIKDALKLVNP